MTSTLTEKAVVGRRILFTYYRDLEQPAPPAHPGIITALVPTQGASLKIRLDGKRTSLHVPPDYEGLRYLDEVLDPVPELPMGRFTPTAEHFGGDWEGVPVCALESEDIIALTANGYLAEAAISAYCTDMRMDLEFVDLYAIQARWAVFEWQPEDSEIPWFVHWTHEGDDMALPLYFLPA